jgi:hypothetical protein
MGAVTTLALGCGLESSGADDTAGELDDGGVSDDATVVVDASGSSDAPTSRDDATTPFNASDGAPASDTGPVVNPSDGAADTGPVGFCSSHATTAVFCVDFDEPGSLTATFCNGAPSGSFCAVTATGDASVALDEAVSFSPPGSMSATTNPVTSGVAQAYGARSLPPELGPIRVGFELRVDALGHGAAFPIDLILGDFVPGSTSSGHTVGAFAAADDGGVTFSLNLQEATGTTLGTPVLVASGLALGAWYHVELVADDAPDAATRGALLVVNDAGAELTFTGTTLDASTRTAAVGAPVVFGASSSWTVHVDDVLATH